MSVWLIALFTAVIAALITALFFTVKGNVKMQKELAEANILCHHLECELKLEREGVKNLEKELRFRDGMQIARKTDTLYQQILKKCAGKEQFTVMMNGTKDGDEK